MDKKQLTKQTRDENIEISEVRREGKKSKEKEGSGTDLGFTKEQIKEKVKPRLKTVKQKEKDRPFIVLKPQEELLIEKDYELVEALGKSYIKESEYGDGLKEKGDYKRTSLKFGHCKECPRSTYYDFFEPERARKYTVKGLILFDDGKRHHKNIQDRLDELGVLRESEGWLHIPEINANGRFDGLIPVGSEGKYTICDILEIKSKLPYACSSVNQDDYDQTQLYHYASKDSQALRAAKIKTRNMRIFYKDRALETDEIHFGWIAKPDPDRQIDIMEYMRFLWNVVYKGKTLVPHPYEKKSKKCTYCRYKSWCWREYPEQVIEKEEDPLEVKLPEQEILDSYAKKIYEILKKEAELKAEKSKLIPILIHYFMKTKAENYPVMNGEGLAPKQGKSIVWDTNGLLEAIGAEMYSKIAKPDGTKITELINKDFVDAGKFELFKKSKPNKPSIYIKKIREA